jgi:hypothetical protein
MLEPALVERALELEQVRSWDSFYSVVCVQRTAACGVGMWFLSRVLSLHRHIAILSPGDHVWPLLEPVVVAMPAVERPMATKPEVARLVQLAKRLVATGGILRGDGRDKGVKGGMGWRA